MSRKVSKAGTAGGIKLTDTQMVILTAAAGRPTGCILPLPKSLKGGAMSKVVTALRGKGLAEEVPAGIENPVWREDDTLGRLTLRITPTGERAIGVDDGTEAQADRPKTPKPAPGAKGKAKRADGDVREPRKGTKLGRVIAMLRRSGGATLQQIVDATDWQPHTARAVLSHAIGKKLGLPVTSEKTEGRGRVYRLAA
jgi:hypothetical protein